MVAIQSRKKQKKLRLLVVEDDAGVAYSVCRWLREQEDVRSVLAANTQEAIEVLRDIIFIESTFDALLVDYNLGDSTGVRVIQEFRDEFPIVPIALMSGSEDISLERWTRAQDIPLFRKPLKLDQLHDWLEGIRDSA